MLCVDSHIDFVTCEVGDAALGDESIGQDRVLHGMIEHKTARIILSHVCHLTAECSLVFGHGLVCRCKDRIAYTGRRLVETAVQAGSLDGVDELAEAAVGCEHVGNRRQVVRLIGRTLGGVLSNIKYIHIARCHCEQKHQC